VRVAYGYFRHPYTISDRATDHSSMVVKFVDENGKTIAVDSRQLLGVKEEEEVVVNCIASRDEQGNVALMATGIFIKR
jgi:hypothetical protein